MAHHNQHAFRTLCGLAVFAALGCFVQAQATIRVMAGNLTSGTNQSYDPGHGLRIFQGVHPDIAMIQQFNFGAGSQSDLRSMVDSGFGADYSYVRGAGTIPNGVISRFPILTSGEWTDATTTNRDFVWAQIDIPGPTDLWAISVNLVTSSPANRNTEATQLMGLIDANIPSGDYVVVGGDFNTDVRTEPCLSTLSSDFVTSSPYPADSFGNGNTSAPRTRPYDWVIASSNLDPLKTSLVIGTNSFPDGLVVDTRIYTPLSDIAPALAGDSGAQGMQHMGVVRDFLIPDGKPTPTPEPSPTPTATQPPEGAGQWVVH